MVSDVTIIEKSLEVTSLLVQGSTKSLELQVWNYQLSNQLSGASQDSAHLELPSGDRKMEELCQGNC